MADLIEVVVGRIGRPHGIRGEATIEVLTDEPERRFAVGSRLVVEGREGYLAVAKARWHGQCLLLSFDGVKDRSAAEELRGAVLSALVDPNERPDDEEEYYDRQLVGLRVLNHRRAEVGRVSSVIHLPTQDLLVVDTAKGERLIPFVQALVPEVDLDRGYVLLSDLPGLMEEA